jgi:hypothetical protein
VENLLSNLEIKSFTSCDEQEVAGYANTMEVSGVKKSFILY